ncbi:MAG TPA: hypothetical protein VGL92_19235 [Acidimicrobiia bacterium]
MARACRRAIGAGVASAGESEDAVVSPAGASSLGDGAVVVGAAVTSRRPSGRRPARRAPPWLLRPDWAGPRPAELRAASWPA